MNSPENPLGAGHLLNELEGKDVLVAARDVQQVKGGHDGPGEEDRPGAVQEVVKARVGVKGAVAQAALAVVAEKGFWVGAKVAVCAGA